MGFLFYTDKNMANNKITTIIGVFFSYEKVITTIITKITTSNASTTTATIDHNYNNKHWDDHHNNNRHNNHYHWATFPSKIIFLKYLRQSLRTL